MVHFTIIAESAIKRNIFGLMPHPESGECTGGNNPTGTRKQQMLQYGDGKLIFQSIVDNLIKKC